MNEPDESMKSYSLFRTYGLDYEPPPAAVDQALSSPKRKAEEPMRPLGPAGAAGKPLRPKWTPGAAVSPIRGRSRRPNNG